MIGLIPKKYLIILAAVIALGVVYYFWRAEIYKAGQNACMLLVAEKTTETNNQSIKGANDVRKKEQSLSKRGVIDDLCTLGIMYENRGCE